jgi:acetylornithine deacetylase/succinyl-diaminopimelate desuccinylase-like protein
MTREQSIEGALALIDDGTFVTKLAGRIAIPTESQEPERAPELRRYLDAEIAPDLARIGFETTILDNPTGRGGPYLIAKWVEEPGLPTLFTYGHGDVVRGMDDAWEEGRSPWRMEQAGDRLYGRGVVDNKGQHTLNFLALEAVLRARGRLGYNVTLFMEMSEEVGSPGVKAICSAHREALRADVFIASDGPRLRPGQPTLYLGARGALNLDFRVRYRDGGHHSGNWGGLLANPAVRLANALSAIVDERGRVRLRDLVPERIPDSIRRALALCEVDPGESGPTIDDWWGEPGLSRAEKVFGWNTFDILAFGSGDPTNPVNAIPPHAYARCQIRYTVDRPVESFVPAISAHLDELGYGDVEVQAASDTGEWGATRLDPDHPWPLFVADSIRRTTGKGTMRVPNFGGSLPNDSFAITLGLPTIFVPHSYPGCSQHAPNEHGLMSVFRESMAVMAGLFHDLGEMPWPERGTGHERPAKTT